MALSTRAEDEYLVGVGKADITGPVADVNLMGYANPTQIAGGILSRQYARAFIVAEARDPSARFVFVNLDACMGSQAVTRGVISALESRFGSLYSDSNVALSGTHTHSGPAGFLQYLVYSLTALGWVSQTYDALVEGIVRAVERAHEDLRPGSLAAGGAELLGANINRSPTAYRANPQWERDMYAHDIDKTLTLLRIDQAKKEGGGLTVGAFSWFPVHGTSVNNTNTLVNGDNKGLASQLMERELLRRAER
ncbi:neutral/alkaline non-lysosomal ceramidase, partial [Helicosporidium sp. ATCC 50920]